jgi:putative membrane protein
MGAADVVPGVSGGTVALVLGIYRRLVTALSHFGDPVLMGLVKRRQWIDGLRHVDAAFLIALGSGVCAGVVLLGGVMNELLTRPSTRPLTLAALFGLILASALLVARLVRSGPWDERWRLLLWGAAGAAFAFWLTGHTPREASMSPWYVFLCGLIGISAMILPGISGAYLLLILGLYGPLTDILKALPRGDVVAGDLGTVAIFSAGCAVGLLSFSKLLRFLLVSCERPTMAVLCGFMVGALRKVWPFQHDLTPEITKLAHKQFQPYLPRELSGDVIACGTVTAVAVAGVLLLDAAARSRFGRAPAPVGTESDGAIG